jgi:hypothetical protein
MNGDGVDRSAIENEISTAASETFRFFPPHSRHKKGEEKVNSQMTLDTTDLLLEYTMPESSLELSRSCRGGSNAHGILTSSDDDLMWGRGGEG